MYALLAVLALSLGPARAVAPAVPGPYAVAGSVDAATNGQIALVVWSDRRSRNGNQLLAARVASDGVVLDPESIEITDLGEQGFADEPRVVWNGRRFIVTWIDQTGSGWATTVTTEGEAGTPVSFGDRSVRAIASQGGRTMVVLTSTASSLGFLDDAPQFTPLATYESLAAPVLAPLASGFVLAWDVPENMPDTIWRVHAQRLDADGEPIGPESTLASLGVFNNGPHLLATADGDDTIIVASDTQRLAVTRLHADGATTSTAELTGEDGQVFIDALVSHANGFDVIAHRFNTPLALDFDRNGAFGGAWIPAAQQPTTTGAGVSMAGQTYALWIIRGNVMGSFTGIADGGLTLLSPAPRAQRLPAVATNGPSVLVAWQEGTDDNVTHHDVMAVIGDGEPMRIGESIDDRLSAPAVTWSGRDWVIVWKNDLVWGEQLYQRLLLRRIAPDGTLSETQTISTLAHDVYAPALASDGTDVLLAWAEGAWSQEPRVRVQLLGHDTFDLPGGRGTPAIAYDGTRYLVVAKNDANDVIGMFVERSGAAGAPFTIAANTYPYQDSAPAVAWNGNAFLVTYRVPLGAFAQEVSREGTLLALPRSLGNATSDPRVTAVGQTFVIALEGQIKTIGSTSFTLGEGVIEPALAPGVIAYSAQPAALHHVPRVFTRLIGVGRERAVRH